MVIFAHKRVGFRNLETGAIFTTREMDLVDAPDCIKADPMFDWAMQDGIITIPENKPADTDPLDDMTKAELIEMGTKLGLELSDKSTKAELLEAVKAARGD